MSFLDKPDVWREFSANPSTDIQAIKKFEVALGVQLPGDYVQFLRRMNGGEGMVGEAYLSLWPIEDIIPRNQACKVNEATPGLLVFGSDGGNEAFGFDFRSDAKEVVCVPFIVLDWRDSVRIALTFTDFLEVVSKSWPDVLSHPRA